ncbi:MAG: UDP-glucose 4-epimerase GalE, partial [Pseudomonadota bacterium]
RNAQRRPAYGPQKPEPVVHCAALIEVATSLTETATYYDCNVGGAITLVKAAQEAGVGAFVFSSTCAVYGPPQRLPLDETHPLAPISPYGRTKMMVEQVLEDLRTHHAFPAVSLRYFNASGAHWQSEIGEKHTPETHAIPLAILAALGRRNGFKIFGTDYDTPDGTAVRDYIHVLDLADAHVRALEYLLAGGAGDVFNLGTGTGSSVRELVDTISKVSGKPFEVQLAERRPGDPPSLVADSSKAERVLGWTPAHTFQDTIESAWMWHSETERHLFQT